MNLWVTQAVGNTIRKWHLQRDARNDLLPWGHSEVFSQLFPKMLQGTLLWTRLWGHSDHVLRLLSSRRSDTAVLSICAPLCRLFLHPSENGPSPCTEELFCFLAPCRTGMSPNCPWHLCDTTPCNGYCPPMWLLEKKPKKSYCR